MHKIQDLKIVGKAKTYNVEKSPKTSRNQDFERILNYRVKWMQHRISEKRSTFVPTRQGLRFRGVLSAIVRSVLYL